ncbi:M14 family zinc carboxypeptidase [Streptomyces sp. NPDC020875]|uniref:M14 family zinc carboxypeptidase n=1 Tax=Streptomyces sp. NPDC020875 TaxID=3154898 RepID=UPI00340D28B5
MANPSGNNRRTFLRTTGSIGAMAAVTASTTGFTTGSGARPEPAAGSWESDLPAMRRYPTLRELHGAIRAVADAHPRRTDLRTIGRSRGGREILLLSVGKGRENALVLGGPHPNEPTGFLTALQLARLAARRPEFAEGLDLTWHIVPCMDPDAAALGDGWYGGPHTIRNYYRNFYRPAFRNQVEWTFPVSGGFDRPLPETRRLMTVIDELTPKLVYSLHSSDFSGFHFMMNRPVPALISDVERAVARRGLPFHRGPVDGGAEPIGPGSFLLPPLAAPGTGEQLPPGASSIYYAARHGALGVLPETPMWHTPQLGDVSDSGHRYAALLDRAAERLTRDGELLTAVADAARDRFPPGSPIAAAVDEGLLFTGRTAGAFREMAADPAYGRPATVAERYDLRWIAYTIALRTGGMLTRLVTDPAADGGADPGGRARLRSWFNRRCAEMARDFPGRAYDPRELAAVQIEIGLAAARAR